MARLICFGLAALGPVGCGGGKQPAPDGGGGGGTGGGDGGVVVSPVIVSAATRTKRLTTWSANYWTWMPTYGDSVTGTEGLVRALAPAIMRVGGYNNDANTPDPFDDAQMDRAVAYARAIGAEPLIQVPHLADNAGLPPTADEAAAMVTYANVTKGYGIKYFSIGNEPDLYDSAGLPSNSAMPAIPGYLPSDFCASAADYVAKMKAADSTIKIVGPDLAYKYQAGNGVYDWLTPILQQCGDLFDIVSIHRYPFEAKQASLAAARADQAAFRSVVASVRGIMTATGKGDKPLALTEMNVVYDASGCVLEASPGTVGSALWLADSVGTAIELGLWTTAVWAISDGDPYALGVIDVPPAHTPRPEYYAYALYADHFGPTVLSVPTVPAGVTAHASRNQADDATEVIVANWNETPIGLAFQVTGLARAPAESTYLLPAVSMAAVEIPDVGPSSAWSYGESQRQSASAPQPLAAGLASSGAGGAEGGGGAGGTRAAGVAVGARCTDAGVVCSQVKLTTPTVTTVGTASATGLLFGTGTSQWGSFTYAGTGQTAPSASVTADGNGIQISGGFVAPIVANNNFEGVGLYYNSGSCLDASSYSGVKFDFAGDLGGCSMSLSVAFSGDLSQSNDPVRGGCPTTTCYGPSFQVTPNPSSATIMVPFTSLTGGMPMDLVDKTNIVSLQWQLAGQPGVTDGGACAASFSVENVAFY